MNIIETQNITYHFDRNNVILNNICLNVPKGSIYGFLGQNGAGKTLTLWIILGLLKVLNGSVSVFAKPLDTNRIEILQKIGSLIENPSFYTHLIAKENLSIWKKIYQCPQNRIEEVLNMVGIGESPKCGAKFPIERFK